MKHFTFITFLVSIFLGNLCIAPRVAAGNFGDSSTTLMSKVMEVSCELPFAERTAFTGIPRKVSCPGGRCLVREDPPDSTTLAAFSIPDFSFAPLQLGLHHIEGQVILRASPQLERPPTVRSILTIVLRE